MELRPYQSEIIESCRSKMGAGKRSILIQSATGSGKTILMAHMLKTASSKNMVSWFIVHRRELIKQASERFKEVGIDFGVISNGFDEDPQKLIQICSVQSLARRHHRFAKPKLVVWDECHHIASNSWDTIFKSYSNSYHVGLTATPVRLDGTGLGAWFPDMIAGPPVKWLIENKFLSPYRLYAPSSVSMSNVHTRMGDFVKSELSSAYDKPVITGNAINEYRKLADGKKAVVFCVSIEHSKHVVEQFQAAGIPAAHVDGETNVNERDAAIEMFKSGEIRVISNVDLFGEGFDLPSIEVAILLRPTLSVGLFLQQIGRALRPCEGKQEAIILDHAGNVSRHGLPDEERDWTLWGNRKRQQSKDGASESVKICGKCFAAQETGSLFCKYCGYKFEIKPRVVKQVDGSLQEVTASLVRRKNRQEQGMAQSMNDLIAIGKSRGYKNPYYWASVVFRSRQAKKLRGY